MVLWPWVEYGNVRGSCAEGAEENVVSLTGWEFDAETRRKGKGDFTSETPSAPRRKEDGPLALGGVRGMYEGRAPREPRKTWSPHGLDDAESRGGEGRGDFTAEAPSAPRRKEDGPLALDGVRECTRVVRRGSRGKRGFLTDWESTRSR